MSDINDTPDDEQTDPNVIAIERDTTHPYEDFSDMYANIFDNPYKHGEDLKWAAETGHRDVFEKLLPKVQNHGEVAAIAFVNGNPSWAQEIVDQYPDNNFEEYFEALLKVGEIDKALALWGTTDTTLSKTSLAFEKAAYEKIPEDYRSEFRELAEEYLTEKQLVDRIVRSNDVNWVQKHIDAGLDFVLDADQIGLLVDQNYIDVIQALSASNGQLRNNFIQAARVGNPALFKHINTQNNDSAHVDQTSEVEQTVEEAPVQTASVEAVQQEPTVAQKRGAVLTARIKNTVKQQKTKFAITPLTPKSLKDKLAEKSSRKNSERAVFHGSLKNAGQLQPDEKPLRSGATHVVSKTDKGTVVRKRFSAV